MKHELYEKLINDGILRKHNLKAYLKVTKEFEKSNRVGIVHATGTGKSFIALQLMYDNKEKNITYLVPRTGIKDQIEEHINNLSENAREKYFRKLNIMTYQKLISMSKEEIENLKIDYLIIDEFHHIGEEAIAWTNAINLLIETHKNLKIFGMTATPIRARGTYRQENVAETLFKGHIASTYTLAQAIADGVLMPPIYKGAVYKLEEKIKQTEEKIKESKLSEKEKKEYLERIENAKKQVLNADSFSKMIRKNIKPTGKYIVFCPRGKREEYQKESEQWFKGFIEEKNITRYFVDSKYSKQSEINSNEFYNDNQSKLRLMFAMDMYIEGIHVPDIDGTIMMRPTKSEIMFFQMIGRNSNKERQTLILDFVNNYEYIMKLKDYTKKELEKQYNNKEFNSKEQLKHIFEQFDIELENIDILNMLEEINKKITLTLEQKIEEYIELLNNGYIPKARDTKTKFSNKEKINYFWYSNKEKIIKKLTTEEKYKIGYEKANKTLQDMSIDKIEEYIKLLNNGYIPKRNDEKKEFSNGEKINQFWANHKEQIIERLKEEKYKNGYEPAHNTIKNLSFDKIDDYIEIINNGYIPKHKDKILKFSNGENVNLFWSNHKEQIIERLQTEEKYKIGYETAHNTIKKLSFDKIADYIELLNKGYIPKAEDKTAKFSNGERINQFWSNHKEQIIERLKEEKYKNGYETAHNTMKSISFDKIADYIELLNQGYIPRKNDKNEAFSNGEPINYFWCNNKEKIIERIETDKKYETGYELAQQIIKIMQIERKKQFILLKELKEEILKQKQYIKK